MSSRAALVLREPTPDDEREVLRAFESIAADVPHFLHLYERGMPFGRYLAALAERRRGSDLPDEIVPATFVFAFVDDRIVGRVSIRHRLTPWLEQFGGHIGYAVVPEFRRRGYATEMLRQAVDLARDRLGLARVLVTCDDDNAGSITVIERNGGVLENVVDMPGGRAPKRRYWIDTVVDA